MWIPLGMAVTSQATCEWESVSKRASKMASAIWSHTLSGCPAVTLSEVKKVVILSLLLFLRTAAAPQLGGGVGPVLCVNLAFIAQVIHRFRGLQVCGMSAGSFHNFAQLFRILQHRARTQMVIVKGLPIVIGHENRAV